MTTKKEVLRLDDVCKSYKMGEQEVRAACGMSFTVYENDFIGILGPSGSGKSTLLHIIGLLDRPTTGKVFVDGTDTTDLSDKEQAQARGAKIGFVFQTFNLIGSLTALENVELPLILYNMQSHERTEKAKTILSKVGLEHRLNHYPGQLSGGERQRVAIARALVNDPEIILADEPTGNLDTKIGNEILSILSSLHKEGKTIIIISHDESITKITKRIFRIRDGKIIEKKV